MKTFEIITEADARALLPGETVTLVAGGHVTPLAQDTLRGRSATRSRTATPRPALSSMAPALGQPLRPTRSGGFAR